MALDTRDLILVVSDKPDPERDAVAASWVAAGGDVLRLGRFWDPPPLDPRRVRLYGADSFCQVLAQKLSLDLVSPPDDLLLQLPQAATKRGLRGVRLSDISQLGFPGFVKSCGLGRRSQQLRSRRSRCLYRQRDACELMAHRAIRSATDVSDRCVNGLLDPYSS